MDRAPRPDIGKNSLIWLSTLPIFAHRTADR
jgi:hypothetical protein